MSIPVRNVSVWPRRSRIDPAPNQRCSAATNAPAETQPPGIKATESHGASIDNSIHGFTCIQSACQRVCQSDMKQCPSRPKSPSPRHSRPVSPHAARAPASPRDHAGGRKIRTIWRNAAAAQTRCRAARPPEPQRPSVLPRYTPNRRAGLPPPPVHIDRSAPSQYARFKSKLPNVHGFPRASCGRCRRSEALAGDRHGPGDDPSPVIRSSPPRSAKRRKNCRYIRVYQTTAQFGRLPRLPGSPR
ncbi:hypothetical protein SAMN05518801_104227 [Novosphingobium sp. CF614]|nr:hypothetical protein SAMN05518801_104227 [Novosphingobium sp. CF614]